MEVLERVRSMSFVDEIIDVKRLTREETREWLEHSLDLERTK